MQSQEKRYDEKSKIRTIRKTYGVSPQTRIEY